MRITQKVDTLSMQLEKCTQCESKGFPFFLTKKHIKELHNTDRAKFCPYCKKLYLSFRISKKLYRCSFLTFFFQLSKPTEQKPFNFTLSGIVETFLLEANDTFDIPQPKVAVKPIVNEEGNESVNAQRQKTNSMPVL